MTKAHGTGSITPLRNGRFWVRSPAPERRGLGTYATREEAEEVLGAARALAGIGVDRTTFATFGASVLDLREADGLRSVQQERARWALHLAECSIAHMGLAEVKPRHAAELVRELARKRAADKRGPRRLSRATVQRCLALVSAVFSEALQRGLVEANPCHGVKVRRDPTAAVRETWAYLTHEEQQAIATCAEIPLDRRIMILFALGTGLRQGEQWHLELRDLHVDGEHPHVFVRFGSKGKVPKSGKTRRVPLFGVGLEAARAWLALLPSFCPRNPEGLVFPTARGHRRGQGKPFGDHAGLGFELAKVGVTRPVRWHDLRHTCASSLIAGWWGRRWTLEEVCAYLGHSSIIVTQRYAHLGETSLKAAARATVPGYAVVTAPEPEGPETSRNPLEVHGKGLEPPRLAAAEPKGLGEPSNLEALRTKGAPIVATLAATFLELMAAGKLDQALAVAMSLANAQIATSRAEEPAPEVSRKFFP